MRGFIDSQRLGESGDRAFRGDISGGVALPNRSNQARHVNNIAPGLPQVREGELASSKDADEIEVDQVAKLIDCKIVYRFVRRMPSSVVDQAIKLSVAGDRRFNQILNVFVLSDIAVDE